MWKMPSIIYLGHGISKKVGYGSGLDIQIQCSLQNKTFLSILIKQIKTQNYQHNGTDFNIKTLFIKTNVKDIF